MSNWLDHVKKTMSVNPGKPLKDILKMAKKTYKKGASVASYAVSGKKATGRKSRKTGRKSKKVGRKSKKGGMSHHTGGKKHHRRTKRHSRRH